ncbi:hypothetical protein MEO39_27000 [Dolichospermum sp. ST_sed2]|nr:hypothetical protein [Dolichospermum sp. ST_sed2]MDD1469755.1 hypothetical protein [Dolichospermum sp. ST_sed5]MDD1475000.1 hypothetical protein [Dolichospermum sp. ST_sed4]
MARFYIPVEIERRVRKDAQNRCGYCLSPQRLVTHIPHPKLSQIKKASQVVHNN